MNPAPVEADKELDDAIERMAYCIGESKDERRDDTSQIFDEMKTALLAWRNKAVVAARIDEVERINHGGTVSRQYAKNRLTELKGKPDNE